MSATSFSGQGFTVNLAVAQPTAFRLGVYGFDFEFGGRNADITVNGETVNFSAANGYPGGIWAIFDVNAPAGTLPITVTNRGPVNAVISAITFDPVPEPAGLSLLAVGAAGLVARRRR